MRFLADENCDFAVVRASRDAGHDVVAVAETARRESDREILDRCLRDKRILVTEDKDFGQLVYASGSTATGVILLRFPGTKRAAMVRAVTDLVRQREEGLVGRFAVLQPGRTRIGKML